MARQDDLKFRRGTASDWTSANPTLNAGEPGFETDTGKLKIGDGTTAWNSLAYVGGGGAFTDLTDVPASYTGESGKLVAVNDTEDGLEFIDTPSSVHAGAATLATGTVTVPATWVTADTVVVALRQAAPGTAGKQIFCDPADHVVATSFTITSEDATDSGSVFWMATEPTTEPESPFALMTDASADEDAYLALDFGADHSEVWLTFGMAVTSASLTYWDGNDYGAAYLAQLFSNADDVVDNLTELDDGGGDPTWSTTWCDPSSPVPVADTWILFELHILEGDYAHVYIDGVLACSNSGAEPDPARKLWLGQNAALTGDENIVYYRDLKVGTTRGASDIFADDFSGDLSAWDSVVGDCTIVANPF